jgi:hypothetical protein
VANHIQRELLEADRRQLRQFVVDSRQGFQIWMAAETQGRYARIGL